MIKKSGQALFIHFNSDHEKSLAAVLKGHDADAGMVDAALMAVEQCLVEIIEELRATDGMPQRQELNVLYEGFSILVEFIHQDVSVPAVRGF